MQQLRCLLIAVFLSLSAPFAWAEPDPPPLPADASVLAVFDAGAQPGASAAALPLPDTSFVLTWSASPHDADPLVLYRSGDYWRAEPGDGDGTDEDDPLGRFKPDHPVDEGVSF
jgi:hypothetical protein